VALPAGLGSKGANARRERLQARLPGELAREEARLFAAAKRFEAQGDAEKARHLFGLSREAYLAAQAIEAAREGGDEPVLDEALEAGQRLLNRLGATLP
jgi:hypothetical protein